MTTQAVASVVLKGLENWFEWMDHIANYARQLNLWQFVDPDAANRPLFLLEPVIPATP